MSVVWLWGLAGDWSLGRPHRGLHRACHLWAWVPGKDTAGMLLASHANCPPGGAKASCPYTPASLSLRVTRV